MFLVLDLLFKFFYLQEKTLLRLLKFFLSVFAVINFVLFGWGLTCRGLTTVYCVSGVSLLVFEDQGQVLHKWRHLLLVPIDLHHLQVLVWKVGLLAHPADLLLHQDVLVVLPLLLQLLLQIRNHLVQVLLGGGLLLRLVQEKVPLLSKFFLEVHVILLQLFQGWSELAPQFENVVNEDLVRETLDFFTVPILKQLLQVVGVPVSHLEMVKEVFVPILKDVYQFAVELDKVLRNSFVLASVVLLKSLQVSFFYLFGDSHIVRDEFVDLHYDFTVYYFFAYNLWWIHVVLHCRSVLNWSLRLR